METAEEEEEREEAEEVEVEKIVVDRAGEVEAEKNEVEGEYVGDKEVAMEENSVNFFFWRLTFLRNCLISFLTTSRLMRDVSHFAIFSSKKSSGVRRSKG